MIRQSQMSINIGRKYMIASIIVALAGAIYELFSHGVYSMYMIYAFMIPLVMGCLPHIMDKKGVFDTAGPVFERLLQASVGTLTIGSLMRGVLEIYGTSNRLAAVYTVLGTLLLVSSIIVFLINTGLRKASDK